MKTYKAAVAPWRLKPLCLAYLQRAKNAARLLGKRRGHANEIMCPYCGTEGRMVATVRIGAKGQQSGVNLTKDGYEVRNADGRETDLLVVHCTKCKAVMEPLAYTSPAVFAAQHLNMDPYALADLDIEALTLAQQA